MKITALEPRKKYLSALYIDGEFALNLDTRVLQENRIVAGTELDDERLRELILLSELRRAKEKALWLLSYRDHSSKELFDKLKRDYSEETAQSTVNRMQELGLLNDLSFAKRYARDLHAKHQSPSTIRFKLTQKGIDRDLSDAIIESLDIDPLAEIQALIEKKYSKNLSDEKGIRRTVAALKRSGYKWSDIQSVISTYTEDNFYF